MIVSAVTSPVTQLAIKYPIRNKEVPRGAYARAIRQIESPLDSAAHGASTAIVLGIATDKTNFESPIPPLAAFCSTANCTFDRYYTLGVCMEIANISSQLKIGQFDGLNSTRVPLIDQFENQLSCRPPGYKLWKASLPGGYDLVHHSTGALILDMLVGNETFGFHDQADLLQTRISSMVLIYSSPIYRDISKGILTPEGIFRMTKKVRHEALEVLFHLCIQTNETQVQGGVERTRMVGSLAKPAEVAEDGPFSLEMNCTGPVLDPQRTIF
ncbi:hypothetical protein MRS44_003690 [Fusarium solani]|uniref:uncharacterized protein n=1 Tax=Fusarium solani TaxID=169388 RepID=UPI0032C3FA6E|nr:hypothetical protein MRS44_003690 [Fusarium solani]